MRITRRGEAVLAGLTGVFFTLLFWWGIGIYIHA